MMNYRNLALISLAIGMIFILSMTAYSICPPTSTIFDPSNMSGSGYVLVYDEEFGAGSIATDISFQAPANVTAGFKLYNSNLVGCGIKPSSQFSINADGSLHDAGFNGGCGYDLSTIGYAPGKSNGPAPWQQNWIGTAFGQGFYQEAKFKFATGCDSSSPGTFAFPTIWGDTAEFEVQSNLNPGGAPHFVEEDQLEWLCGTPTIYYNNFHDWWNNMAGHIQISNNITPPAGTNFTQYHTYGQLVVWGGANGSCATGYRQAYFDGGAVGNKITWQDCDEITVPPTGTNVGNAIDGGHQSTNIGTGVSNAMDTLWIRVWQLPNSATASGNSTILVPDLTVTAVGYNTSTHQFSSTIQNVGPVATPSTKNVNVSYLSDGVVQTFGTITTSIASGASVAVGNTGPTITLPTGGHTIAAFVNDDAAIPESNRSNNKLLLNITAP